jgi:hypothetical protein
MRRMLIDRSPVVGNERLPGLGMSDSVCPESSTMMRTLASDVGP